MDMVDGVPFHELAASDFPFTVKFFRQATGELVHEFTVPEPGMISIPALSQDGPVNVEIHWPDGTVEK